MKHCPQCDFSFADFHHVCDFDGTELVPDAVRPSLVNTSSPASRFWRTLKSPVFLAVVGLIAVLSSALLIGYYDSASQSTRVVKDRPSPTSVGIAVPSGSDLISVAPASDESRTHVKKPEVAPAKGISNSNRLAKSSSASGGRQASPLRSLARLRQKNIGEDQARVNQLRKLEIARRSDPQQIPVTRKSGMAEPTAPHRVSYEKERKLTAMLKTTWHVLKKPFKL